MIDRQIANYQIDKTLKGTDLDLGQKYEGKVRDNYISSKGTRYIVVTDRISAFDRVLCTIPFKGQVLNKAAQFWFELTKDAVPNHMINVPDPNVMEAVECTTFPVEMVMRAYLTGVTSTAIWTHYNQGEREFCGHKLPDGMVKNQPLPRPILTPSTKAPKGGHDISVSKEEILKMGVVSTEDFNTMADMSMELFQIGQKHCDERGVILVDTKYEFGRTKDGKIVVIDEVHTPDSSRFWLKETYEQKFSKGDSPQGFDKEYVRMWLSEQGFIGEGDIPDIPAEVRVEATMRYIYALERITGIPFEPDTQEPESRINRNLGL